MNFNEPNNLILTSGIFGKQPGDNEYNFDSLFAKSYVNNKYMAKKWKSLLRVKKLQGPSWAEALYRTCFFIKPVWQVLSNDEVFFD